MARLILLISIINLYLFANEEKDPEVEWLDRKAEGWIWYEDKKEETEPEKKEPSPIVVEETQVDKEELSAVKKLAKIKEDIDEKLAKAILEPNGENVEVYMKAQQYLSRKGEAFAKSWNKVLLLHPELDNTVVNPVSQYGIAISKRIQQEQKELHLKTLGKKYLLLFFFDSKCDFAKSFASIVQNFSDKYGWKLIGVSLDGGTIEGITSIPKKSKMTARFNIKFSPAVMIFDPKIDEAKPVGWGILTQSQLEDNIVQQFEKKEF